MGYYTSLEHFTFHSIPSHFTRMHAPILSKGFWLHIYFLWNDDVHQKAITCYVKRQKIVNPLRTYFCVYNLWKKVFLFEAIAITCISRLLPAFLFSSLFDLQIFFKGIWSGIRSQVVIKASYVYLAIMYICIHFDMHTCIHVCTIRCV